MNYDLGSIGQLIENLNTTIKHQASLIQQMQKKMEGLEGLQKALLPSQTAKQLQEAKGLTGRKIAKVYHPGSTIDTQDNLPWRELKTKTVNGVETSELKFKGGIRVCITEHDKNSKKTLFITDEDGKKRKKYLTASLSVEQVELLHYLVTINQFDERYSPIKNEEEEKEKDKGNETNQAKNKEKEKEKDGFQSFGKRTDKETGKLYSIALRIKNEKVKRRRRNKKKEWVEIIEDAKVITITEAPGKTVETGGVVPCAPPTLTVRKEMSFEEFEKFVITNYNYIQAERIRSSLLGLPFATLMSGGKQEPADMYDVDDTSETYHNQIAQEEAMEYERPTPLTNVQASQQVAKYGNPLTLDISPFDTVDDEDMEILYINQLSGKRFRDLDDTTIQQVIKSLQEKIGPQGEAYWNNLYEVARRVLEKRDQSFVIQGVNGIEGKTFNELEDETVQSLIELLKPKVGQESESWLNDLYRRALRVQARRKSLKKEA